MCASKSHMVKDRKDCELISVENIQFFEESKNKTMMASSPKRTILY